LEWFVLSVLVALASLYVNSDIQYLELAAKAFQIWMIKFASESASFRDLGIMPGGANKVDG